MNVDDLGWPVMVLAGSGADFVVEQPPELAEKVAEVGALFSRAWAGAGAGGSPMSVCCPEGLRTANPHWSTPTRASGTSAGAGASSTTHSEGRGTDRIERLAVSSSASRAEATTRTVIAVVPPWCSSR